MANDTAYLGSQEYGTSLSATPFSVYNFAGLQTTTSSMMAGVNHLAAGHQSILVAAPTQGSIQLWGCILATGGTEGDPLIVHIVGQQGDGSTKIYATTSCSRQGPTTVRFPVPLKFPEKAAVQIKIHNSKSGTVHYVTAFYSTA